MLDDGYTGTLEMRYHVAVASKAATYVDVCVSTFDNGCDSLPLLPG